MIDKRIELLYTNNNNQTKCYDGVFILFIKRYRESVVAVNRYEENNNLAPEQAP